MKHTFKKHPLTVAEKLWLKRALDASPLDCRVAKVELLSRLPRHFDPDAIDYRVYQGGRLTLIGIWLVDRNNEIFANIDSVVVWIAKAIRTKPGIERFMATDIAAGLRLSVDQVGKALYHLGQVGRFFSSSQADRDPMSIQQIGVTGDKGYDAYLWFDGIESVMEAWYTAHTPSREVPVAGFQFPVVQEFFGSANFGNIGSQVAPRTQPSLRQQPNKAFILMSMDPNVPELADTYDTVKESFATFGIAAQRADDIEHQEQITTRILEEIATCEFILADLTFERPNVYYEIGFAHAHNKKPILLRKRGTKLHFDLSVHNVPEYANMRELKIMLRKRLTAICGREPKSKR